MLELLLCSAVTVLPDYLYRRYAQDKRIGRRAVAVMVIAAPPRHFLEPGRLIKCR